MFSMGRNVDFEGLQVEDEVQESYASVVQGGKDIKVNKLLNEYVDENSMFDKDIGKSLKEK